MARLVLTDASPLIGLSRVNGVGWLRSLFGTVSMTEAVYAELGAGEQTEADVIRALEEGWLVVTNLPRRDSAPPSHLGVGEWSSILAALEHGNPALLLMDDRLARREARRLGVRVVGTAALVGMAEARGIIASARDVFEQLLQSSFRISPDVIRAVLEALERGE